MASTVVKQLLTEDEDELLFFVPNNIIVNILKWLPVKSLLRFRCVCKDWNDLFKTSSFIKQHFHHSIHGPSLLLYSSNIVPLNAPSIYRSLVYSQEIHVEIYSLSTGSWKEAVEFGNIEGMGFICFKQPFAVTDQAMYFFAYKKDEDQFYMPSPNFLDNKELITTYENKLALLSHSELWIMEEEATSGGSEQRWNKEFISSARLFTRVVDAVQSVKTTNARGEIKYLIKGINILKAHGKSARDSYLMNGYALNTGRAAQGMPLRVAPAKIACLDFNLQKTKMQLGVQVLVSDPRELEKIRQREADMTKERIEKLLKAGANVILTTKGIDDMALKYFVGVGAIAVRRVRKEDMRHVAKATGATLVSTFADMEGEETFEPTLLGYADEVVEERISDDAVIMIKGTKNTSAVSLILRGANDYMLDEMERALHDALSIVKRTLESNTLTFCKL
ncbi:hypothetical protein K1719_008188 [Acacia pycnantha]|nr:hypothetical protein K1719_008188 [Acacia pycnantha]